MIAEFWLLDRYLKPQLMWWIEMISSSELIWSAYILLTLEYVSLSTVMFADCRVYQCVRFLGLLLLGNCWRFIVLEDDRLCDFCNHSSVAPFFRQ